MHQVANRIKLSRVCNHVGGLRNWPKASQQYQHHLCDDCNYQSCQELVVILYAQMILDIQVMNQICRMASG